MSADVGTLGFSEGREGDVFCAAVIEQVGAISIDEKGVWISQGVGY